MKTARFTKLQPRCAEVTKIDLPTGSVRIGPGTVPTSGSSVSKTSIKEMSDGFKRASSFGVFDEIVGG